MPGTLSNVLSTATSFAEGGDAGALEFREYFAAACPHCVHLSPAWKAASEMYTGPVKFRQVMCADESWNPVEENRDLCENIMGFPTMKMFKGDEEVAEYEGARSANELVKFAQQWGGEGSEGAASGGAQTAGVAELSLGAAAMLSAAGGISSEFFSAGKTSAEKVQKKDSEEKKTTKKDFF